MIFKVYFQDSFNQVPVRERTKTIFMEGESESDIRKKLVGRNYNIEFVTPVTGKYLEYEQQSENYELENV